MVARGSFGLGQLPRQRDAQSTFNSAYVVAVTHTYLHRGHSDNKHAYRVPVLKQESLQHLMFLIISVLPLKSRGCRGRNGWTSSGLA